MNKVVEAISNCKNGKVIISGIGKSGIIGQKISSTLASVGIPSFYVDAASCSHGDLGKIRSNDVLILISFSGESLELKNIIQYASRNKKITLIGIVSKKNSILYKSSDIKLLIPNVVEAGPGNIVPTSSTVITLSIGDALAISTMSYRKFGKFDLKVFINKLDSSEHYAITKGKFFKNRSVRVRVISTNILKNITNFKKNTFNNSLNYLTKFNNFALIVRIIGIEDGRISGILFIPDIEPI